MRKRIRLAVLCFLLAVGFRASAEDRPRSQPNVVLFLADDVGYGDVGIYGGVVPTPNIDRLARDGMRFTDAHAPAALCAPSRSDVLYELDLQLGALIAKLRDEGLLSNTIIIFTSDNGALWPNVVEHGDPRHDNNGPFRDYKASVYEGGHRVPFIARWGDGTPAGSKIAPGSISDQLIVNHDWVATMYELTGQAMSEDQAMDSASLLPILTGTQKGPLHEFVIYQAGFAYEGAIREGSMVLLIDRKNEATELYDLATDIGQERNLIADSKYADEVVRLRAKFLEHNDHDDKTFDEPRTTKAFGVARK